MEHSSPLAAMQPPSMLFGHCFRAESSSYSSCAPRSGLGPSPFNFKDLSMKKGHGDYLNMKPVRGSSPTASLAADLSQNFHIDQRCVKLLSSSVCFIFIFFHLLSFFIRLIFFWTLDMCYKGTILTLNIVRNWLRHDGLCSPPTCLVSVMDVVRRQCNMTAREVDDSLCSHPLYRRYDDHPTDANLFSSSRYGYYGNVTIAP